MQVKALSIHRYTPNGLNKAALKPKNHKQIEFEAKQNREKNIVLSSIMAIATLLGTFYMAPQKTLFAEPLETTADSKVDQIRAAEKLRNQALQKWESLELQNSIEIEANYLNDFHNLIQHNEVLNKEIYKKSEQNPKIKLFIEQFKGDMDYIQQTLDILLQEFNIKKEQLLSIPEKVNSEKLTPIQKLAISEYRGAVGSTLRISHEDIVREADLYENNKLLELRKSYRQKAVPIEDQISLAKEAYNDADQALRKIKEK